MGSILIDFHLHRKKRDAKCVVGLNPKQRFIGCFGRIRHQKGTDIFVDAMIQLLPGRPQWSAIVAGRATGPHQDFERSLKDRVEAAGLGKRILFVGEHTDIQRWYAVLDVFIAPQRWEGFGLTPLEAMATGIPVVATDVGAFPERIAANGSEIGAIVARDNLTELAKAAAKFMDDDVKLGGMAAKVRNHIVRNFSIEREAVGIEKVYRNLEAHGADGNSGPIWKVMSRKTICFGLLYLYGVDLHHAYITAFKKFSGGTSVKIFSQEEIDDWYGELD